MNNKINTVLVGKLASFSEVIDIGRLERENRKTLVVGYIVAVLFILALNPFFTGKPQNVATAPVLKEFRIPVSLVTIPAETPRQEAPAALELQAEKEQIARSPEPVVVRDDYETAERITVAEPDTTEIQHPEERKRTSLLFQPPPVKRLPSLAENPRTAV